MSWIKKQLPFLILVAIVYGSYFFTHLPKQEEQHTVLSANTNLTLFTQPESAQQPIVEKLRAAQKEILMTIYLLSDKQIISALEEAKERGVHVVVMMEEHPFGGGNLNSKTAEELKSKGVEVGWANPDFTLTHQKSIIIDQTYLYILNQNLTASAFSKNREYNILDTNQADIQEVRSMFIADWQRKQFTPSNQHLIVSPVNSRRGVSQLILKATKSIDMELEVISDDEIVDQLLGLAQTHTVRLLAPTLTQISSNEDTLRKLAAGGVHVRTLSSPYIHAKLILVDQKTAYLGSVNMSSQSMDENRELGIILDQPDIIQTLMTDFEKDFAKGSELQ